MSNDILDDITSEETAQPPKTLFEKVLNVSFFVIFFMVCLGFILNIFYNFLWARYIMTTAIVLGVIWIIAEGYRRLTK